jgi:diaminohydroxyphosphoribosylaminopyrimidine deaminase/5-amino-6-(5-phosphoribosylamino)uracil reductase
MAIFSGIKELKESIGAHSVREIDIPEDYVIHPGDDHRFMARALKLAEKGIFTTHPNPRVGCVITKNGVVVGEGYHRFAGEAHAEVNALKQAGKNAKGGTLYVNLEPCCHQGRTPPCTDAIIKAGVSRVVIAMEDPNPLVNRAGISALQKAGIAVETGINHDRAMRLNRGFIRRIVDKKPWVTLKIAVSLDGKTAMKSGESQWITSEPARLDAHRLRAASSAILTGIGTVLRDDPKMTARLPEVERQPLRIILDSRLSTPANAQILNAQGAVLIMTAPNTLNDAELYPQKNVEVIGMPVKGGSIDIQEVLLELGRREINELMLEAGSRLSGAMLEQGMVDELVVYMAPDLLGSDARGMFQIPGINEMHDKHILEFNDIRKVGRDIRLNLQFRSGKQ